MWANPVTFVCGRFNWKLSVAIYLVLELISQQFLAPRVYKKAKDTRIDLMAKLVRRRAAAPLGAVLSRIAATESPRASSPSVRARGGSSSWWR